jgi:hypothetical protein
LSYTLGTICARGGSKGVPGKNLRVVAGHPLIAYSIAQGRRCPFIDRLVVSTDSADIADVARAYGADVPFLRPAELARDDSPKIPAIQHAVAAVERDLGRAVVSARLGQGGEPDQVGEEEGVPLAGSHRFSPSVARDTGWYSHTHQYVKWRARPSRIGDRLKPRTSRRS